MTSAPAIGAIETTYQGIRFRSRLEARWAVFFDAMEWPWEYEPEGYTDGTVKYLPDFWLSDKGRFFEVKRYMGSDDPELDGVLTKAYMLVDLTQKTLDLALGFPGFDDKGLIAVLNPDGSQYLRRWTEFGPRQKCAAATARAYRFWDPS